MPPMRTGKNITTYMIGYEGMTIEAFIASLCAEHIAHLVDIREVALSRKKKTTVWIAVNGGLCRPAACAGGCSTSGGRSRMER